MASDPAFLFYPNDFIGGTMGMTLEEKGAYMELLMAQFNRGHFSDLMATRIIGENLWAVLKQKFSIDESGCYYNKRLEIEVNKRKAYSESRRNNLSGNKDKNSHMEDHMDTHMESHMATHMDAHMENRNSNRKIGGAGGKKTKKQDKVFVQPSVDEVRQYCLERRNSVDAERFIDYYISNGWMVGKNKMKDWEAAVRTWEKTGTDRQQTLLTSKQTGGNQLDRLRAE